MKIIIAGGIDFDDYKMLEKECDAILDPIGREEILYFICGHGAGVDKIGTKYGFKKGDYLERYAIDCARYGDHAGVVRNHQQLDNALTDEKNMLIAFWDGNDSVTLNMIEMAKNLGIKDIHIIMYNKNVNMEDNTDALLRHGK